MKREEKKDYYEELVPIMIASDTDDADAVVVLNGYTYVIQKNQTVSVPRKVALLLEDSLLQKKEAKRYIEALAGR